MTDAEVMKNTRCCADNYCKNCSLQGKPNCKNMLLSFAWNTMYNQKEENDRQKAEIERLQKECEITRAYLHDNGLEWDLLSYSTRKEKE